MKKSILTALIALSSFSTFSQQSDVLLTINDKPVYVDEFKRVYEKNLDIVEDEDSKDIDKYLQLYIDYKLKVNEAFDKKLDTAKAYKRELDGYKRQLMTPYLQDQEFVNKLIKEAYNRTKTEVKAAHVLVRFPKHMNPNDTLQYYDKILKARNRIVAGEDFAIVAREMSEDPSVKVNGGNLGYFKVFRMVYPFEDAAYKTKKGEVSMPFKTRFGYHIVKVLDKRESKGDFEAAHILVRDKSIIGKVKIDSAYQKLKEGKSFEELAKIYSEDKGTSNIGGKLPKFGTGMMVEPFETAVQNLKNINDYSAPFRTKYGWHIVKLLKKYPIESFEKTKPYLTKKVKSSNRIRLSDQVVLNKLKDKYKIKVNAKAFKVFEDKNFKNLPKSNFQNDLLSINDKKIKQEDFYKYVKNRHHHSIEDEFEKFKDKEILNYFKENLINSESDFRNTFLEYKEGLLLFELMQQKVWNKSSKDTLGLKSFFAKNNSKYKGKELDKIKGQVISDYQKELEENWLKELRNNNKVRIRKKTLKKLKKTYNQS
ncbi:peptidylprolyl isomerase [Tenacibaculum holothuriorum]|uniref:Peptidylprolyl isomerase n=1 Tax=Tenacibaculum holothuriorum TaxID=1635173 RepID=A0A1Y2PIL6_9FLAO|nr:peptidylprolyl isomerase [Tenacibaculum holothuriorum]OSY89538.1 peptidylprolyl isomerase [Tenacibaculum holothuriorum]